MKKLLLLVMLVCTVVCHANSVVKIHPSPVSGAKRIAAFNATTLCLVQGSSIFRTNNKLETWTSVSFNGGDSTISFDDISADGSTGFIAANITYGQNQRHRPCVLRTTNAGLTWQEVFTLDSLNYLFTFSTVKYSGSTVVAGNQHTPRLFISYDSGENWQVVANIPEPVWGSRKILVDNGTFYYAGYENVYACVNGSQWFTAPIASHDQINVLVKTKYGLSGVGTYVTNSNVALFKRSVAANGWMLFYDQPPYTGGEFTDIQKTANGNMYMCGQAYAPASMTHSLVYESTNDGTSWNLLLDSVIRVNGGINRLEQIEIGGNTSFINGTVTIITIDDVVTNVGHGESSNMNFQLKQNYPNPFNPVTKINFSLPKNDYVSLKVYDLTGRVVQELVNEVKTAGEHSVQFNGANLSSGIYFYKLTTDSFTETKKMMLSK